MIKFIIAITTILSVVTFPPNKQKQIELEVDKAIAEGLDGVILYIQTKQEIIQIAKGHNNRDTKTPAQVDDLFKIASISKLYIACAVTRLSEQGVLDLDQSLLEYLPDHGRYIENSKTISLRHMIQHRSGIPDYSRHKDYPWEHPYQQVNKTYELIYHQKANFSPNRKYEYSNTNYLLIGEILDRALGYSHHEYINEEILEPLGLNNTYHILNEVDKNEVMSGYFVGYNQDIKNNNFIQPGGSMISTAEDVGVFLKALNTGTLLTSNEMQVYQSLYKFSHTGLLPGYQSIARYDMESDILIVQFNNTSGSNSWYKSERLYRNIKRILKD
ncbi:MAG: serine hydrolase domain-containing protein [Flavobacteriaceae bacterium]